MDGVHARRVAERLDAGIVWINSYNLTPVEMPFGGFKQSGIGKENSRRAFEHYTRLKTVTTRWPEGIKSGAVFTFPTMN